MARKRKKDNGEVGTIYLIHFERKLKHAGHYIGWTANLDERIERHRDGTGSKLLRAAKEAGIEFAVVTTKQGTRTEERRMHKQNNTPRLCPVCQKQKEGQTT